jgi:putative inorganic carbon (HCO3(-)) transporter
VSTSIYALRNALRQADGSTVAAIGGAVLVGVAVAYANFAVAGVLVLLALVVALPVEMSLGVFVFSIPFDTILLLGNSKTSLSWLAGAFAGAIIVVYGFVSRRLGAPPRSALWWGLFAVWSAISILWAQDPATSLVRFPTVIFMFALYLALVSFRITRQELTRLFQLAVVGGAITSAILIYEVHRLGVQDRATLIFGNREANPNDVAISLLLPFALVLGGMLSAQGMLRKVLLGCALVLNATAVYLTMSRGALVALAVTLVVFLFNAGALRRMVLPVLVIVLPVFLLPSMFFNRLAEAPEGRGTGRLDIFIAGKEIVKHNPVIGVGLANFPVVYEQYSGYAPIFRGYHLDPHNMFLQVWAETGVIGFALFLAALVMQLRRSREGALLRRNYMGVAVHAACLGMLVAGLSGNIQWSKGFWLDFILLALVVQVVEREGEPAVSTEERGRDSHPELFGSERVGR